MKTAYYTFTTGDDDVMAAGFDSRRNEGRPAAMVHSPEESVRNREENKVIDLTAWRAASQTEPDWDCGEPDWADEEPVPAPPVPRPRRSHRAVFTAELISTLCVVAVAVALIVRVLTF